MKQKMSSFKWICAASAFAFFAACSSSDSGTNVQNEESSSSAETLENPSSSSVVTETSSAGGASSASENDSENDSEEISATDTDTLSTSTWLTWETPNTPTSVAYAAPDSAVIVTLAESGFTVTNAGIKSVSVSGNKLVVGSAGLYVFSGSMSDGQILVTADDNATVEFVFNGVQLGNSENAPLFLVSGDKLKLELVEGSVNILSDARNYAYMSVGEYTEQDSVPKACVYGREDLTIKGNGTLYVTGNYNNGIHTKADLVINDNPTIYVNSVNNSIKGKGSVRINEGGTYYLRTGDGSGIVSDKETDPEKGRVCIKAGTFTMDVGNSGIKAFYTDSISGGTYAIHSADDAVQASTVMVYGGDFDVESGDEGFNAKSAMYLRGGSAKIAKSSKPFVAATAMTVSGGNWLGLGGGFAETMVPTDASVYTVAAELPTDIASGATVTIENGSGSVVLSGTATKNISSIFAASGSFDAGTYTVYADGASVCSFTFDGNTFVASTCSAE
ncbi:MAG: carbohydrate-binding domain-containing protein [Fibrobacter sp.]|nr:carbohydrate-binding domain-containing protein [Fibrobacter sp.]